MNKFRLLAAVVAMSTTAASVAAAQTCIGRPDLTVMRSSLGATVQLADDVTAYSGRVGVNSNTSFGGLSIGTVSFDGADDNATTFGADLGVERHFGSSQGVHVCPILALSFQNGPDVGNTERSAFGGSLSAAFGASFPMTEEVSFVPFASVGVLSQRFTVERNDDEDSNTETGGQLGVGASFRFNSTFALTPSVVVPIGIDGADTVFSLGATLGFGRR